MCSPLITISVLKPQNLLFIRLSEGIARRPPSNLSFRGYELILAHLFAPLSSGLHYEPNVYLMGPLRSRICMRIKMWFVDVCIRMLVHSQV